MCFRCTWLYTKNFTSKTYLVDNFYFANTKNVYQTAPLFIFIIFNTKNKKFGKQNLMGVFS